MYWVSYWIFIANKNDGKMYNAATYSAGNKFSRNKARDNKIFTANFFYGFGILITSKSALDEVL